MLSPETEASIPDWVDRKDAQWERISGIMPGLQLVRSRGRTQYMLACSTDGFYEGLLIGQLPEEHYVMTGSSLNPRRRAAEIHEKPHDRREIDLTDDQIDQILQRWAQGATALNLPFVDRVWNREGAPRVLKT